MRDTKRELHVEENSLGKDFERSGERERETEKKERLSGSRAPKGGS